MAGDGLVQLVFGAKRGSLENAAPRLAKSFCVWREGQDCINGAKTGTVWLSMGRNIST
jgi:hypothetical protein